MSREEFDALIKGLEGRVEEKLKQHQAQTSLPIDAIDTERESIAAEIATNEEKALLWDALVDLRDAAILAEPFVDAETAPADLLEDLQAIRDLIVDVESALDTYDPS